VYTFRPGEAVDIIGLASTRDGAPELVRVEVAGHPAPAPQVYWPTENDRRHAAEAAAAAAEELARPTLSATATGVLVVLRPGQRVLLGTRWRDGVELVVRIEAQTCGKSEPVAEEVQAAPDIVTSDVDALAAEDVAADVFEPDLDAPYGGHDFDADVAAEADGEIEWDRE
jgi:hypothetical protein